MIVSRRGLSVRTVENDYLKKETLGMETSSSMCQHCGAARSALKSPQQSHAATQAPDGTAKELEMLCCEEPSVEYWKALAESRRLALVESLSENEELCVLVEKLNAEIERLSKVDERAKTFVADYLEVMKEESLQLQD
ncbi:unnamed protein product [Mesocestoides corti]|uniref:Geminin n=1 Tax=Mesocestoides corti TaxID=53468 RepID=A0A0R3UQX2_MESCO|nr:unnamed protein product [Mesocestoides corti]